MKPRLFLSLLVGAVLPAVITTPLGAVGASAGSGGANTSATLPVPLERYYALVRPFEGHADERSLTFRKITPSGRLLLEKFISSGGVQSGTVVGYRWHQGAIEAISSPASPWIYGSVATLSNLTFKVHDMNDSGDIAGMAWSSFTYYDNDYQRNIATGENLWVVWPSAATNAPVLVNPGIIDTSSRLHTYSYVHYLYPRIDNTGRLFGIGSLSEWANKGPNLSLGRRDIAWDDLFSTTSTSVPLSRTTNNVLDTYRLQQITDMTPSGKLLVDRQKDDGINREVVADQTVFPYTYTNGQYFGYTPSVINDSGRVAGQDYSVGKFAWRTLSDPNLQYLEGRYPRDMNSFNDILAPGMTNVHKLWYWPRDPQALQEYSEHVITTTFSSTDTLLLQQLNDQGMLTGTLYTSRDLAGNLLPSNQWYSRPALLVPAELAVDANRDGLVTLSHQNIDPALADTTSQLRPLSFWVNGDIDRDDKDLTTGHAPDWQDGLIQCKRDLEDFARIQISLGGLREAFAAGNLRLGLEWKQTTGLPSIQLYPQIDQTGSDDYLKNEQKAVAQIEPGIPTGRWALQSQSGAIVIGIGQPTILPALASEVYFPDFLTTGLMPLLFEGCTEGKGQLCLTIHNASGVKIGEGPGVWIEIKNIKAMYERARATTNYAMSPNGIDYTMPLPHDTVSTQPTQPVMGWEPDDRGIPFVADPNENTTNKSYVVFVHGWRQSPDDINPGFGYGSSTNFAETMFKRLWHAGYRGRFAAFRWPTFYGGPSPDDDFTAGYSTYNDSEYRAWKSGESLKQYVNQLPSEYRRNLSAHSMGNVVAGSAFLGGMQIDQYMMLNAAVPAIAYDVNAPRNPFGLSQELQNLINSVSTSLYPTYDNTPNDDPEADIRAKSYAGKLQSINADSRVINFYLEADFATRASWNASNIVFRPQTFNHAITPPNWDKYPGYSYNRNALYSKLLLESNVGINELRAVSDPHEVMAYDCKSPTQTVNAEGSSIDGPIDEKIDMSAYGFGTNHSAEWNLNIQQAHQFYQVFLDKVNRSSP